MVEAAGVEPASENFPLWRLHTYPEIWLSPLTAPSGWILKQLSRYEFRRLWIRRTEAGYPAVDALIGSAGVIRQDGSLSGYSVVIIVCDYIYSRQFNERAGARYAAKVSISPSKPLRPPFAEMMLKNRIYT